jgi:hypothetical protein
LSEEIRTVTDVADLIREEKINKLVDTVANDGDDERDIQDLFETYTSEDIRTALHVEPEVEMLYEGPEYVLVSSVRYGRSGVERSKYRITLVIGHDPDQSTGFFVHRIRGDRDQVIDEVDVVDKQLIRGLMGYDEEFTDEGTESVEEAKSAIDLDEGGRYRIQGDIGVERTPQTVEEFLQERLDELGRRFVAERKREVVNRYLQDSCVDPVFSNESGEYRLLVAKGFDSFDEALRATGSRASEEGLSEAMQERGHSSPGLIEGGLSYLSESFSVKEGGIVETLLDWKRRRRCESVWSSMTKYERRDVVRDTIRRTLDEIIPQLGDGNGLDQSLEDTFLAEVRNECRQQNEVIGNHILILSDAVRFGEDEGPGFSTENDYFIVLDESNLFAIHDEHMNKKLKLERGVYRIEALDDLVR